ncbi:morphogenetic protein [Nitrosomonas supralitoralis]|uniref:Morphogenetic protein n=1 Tax=Nitrosomonas supralitoralis TaxID=2116706 RepID=A0A2P7NRB5_9PROT|nr:morphogenetic protein [Nitrosomonas supralitoralis]
MKERPILFSAPMIRAILEGRKTQTRMIMKHQPPAEGYQLSWLVTTTDRDKKHLQGKAHWININGKNINKNSEVYFNCPYGKSGDRLWVRETWQHENYPLGPYESDCQVFYRADYMDDPLGVDLENSTDKLRRKWNPSIHMPREASRILLEITNVRIERLRDISEEDAKAEGAYPIDFGFGDCYAMGFNEIWESINGIGSWDSNPYCWVIEFKVISK